jgi:hypothetical protein
MHIQVKMRVASQKMDGRASVGVHSARAVSAMEEFIE